jgi:predicted RNase H-like HicB family nuclease
MIDLPYSLVIEATEEPDFFSYFSPDLAGFSGVGHSIGECIDEARDAMAEHTALLVETHRPVPPRVKNPTVTVQNARPLERAA